MNTTVINSDKMVVQLTAAQLSAIIESTVSKVLNGIEARFERSRHYASSIKEFADIIGVNASTVHRWKNAGLLEGATFGYSHSVIIDVDKDLEAINAAGVKRARKEARA